MLNSFSKFMPFGSTMPKVGISKFSAKNGDTRIRILSISDEDFLITKVHYLKGVGSFHCFGGSCCQVVANAPEGEANTTERAILPIAVATPSVAGGITVEYMYLPLSEKKYSQLVALNQNVGDITSYDILIQCSDEKYQSYTFLPLVGQESVILTASEMPKAQGFITNYRANIMKTLGKSLDENTFAAARAKSLQQAANSVGVTFTPNASANQAFAQPQPMPALPTAKPVNIPPVTVAPQPQVVETPVVQSTVVQSTVAPQPQVVAPAEPVQVVETPVAPQPQVQVVETPVAPQPQVVATPAVETPQAETTEINWADFMNS